ncbi:MAG: lytic transglycosylase domain-containing protein [Vitreoscilla sp.]|nr:lytic transglycosylase domain-containing protein [Polaromonas sp.]
MPLSLTYLKNRSLGVFAALLMGLFALPAVADVWGYVDAKGVAHFSNDKLDERYELFFKGGESFSTEKSDKSSLTPLGKTSNDYALPAGSARAPTKLLAYFDVSPNYKAVKHLLKDAAQTHGIDYELLQALIATESGFDTFAVSPKGAVGLMQLMPPTAERYGVKADTKTPIEKKLTDPKTNIKAGSTYLRDLIKMFPGQLELAVAAYNAGEGAVQRAGNKIPNYPETKNYVKTVMQLYGHLKPPAVVLEARKTSGRVRMEMMGGASSATSDGQGRGNMPPLLVAMPTEPTTFQELKAK